MQWVFWSSILLVVYSYFLYPCLLILANALTSDRSSQFDASEARDSTSLPRVSVVVAAYNEESTIRNRIENLLVQDYPAGNLTIFVGSDGSIDGTREILNSIVDPRVKVSMFATNRGKASVLNDLVALAETDLLVFTDANTEFAPDAIRKLVRHFSDPHVGAVSGELHLRAGGQQTTNEEVYWLYEQKLKFYEGRLNGLLGANGAIYAIRRELYAPLPSDTVVDDFTIAMEIARKGFLLKYDPEAMAWEDTAQTLQGEIERRIRIGAGNYQAFFRMPWALNPLLGWRFVSYLSHKVLRWFTPHLLVITLLSNLWLAGQPTYFLLFLIQAAFYLFVWFAFLARRSGRDMHKFSLSAVFFLVMNVSLLHGFVRFITKNVQGNWQRTER